jgi:methylase of polypeptide subunit release factors
MRAPKGVDEFGDFQTPLPLATDVCRFLAGNGIEPAAVVEPTCGVGNFVLSAVEQWPNANHLGVEINPVYVENLLPLVGRKARVEQQNFFTFDWLGAFRDLPEPVLVLGNPPWVTNARLGSLGSSNLPEKSNFQGHVGLDAITGKSNFDISEWMLIRLL